MDRRSSTDLESIHSDDVERSRSWSNDVQKHWNLPVLSSETLEQRLARYTEYFTLTDAQLTHIHQGMLGGLDQSQKLISCSSSCSYPAMMMDACMEKKISGNEKGIHYCLDFNGTCARALRVRLEGKGKISTTETRRMIDQASGLMAKETGAMQLFDFLVATMKELMDKHGDLSHVLTDDVSVAPVEVAFVVGFPCFQRSGDHAQLLSWTKGFETGRSTSDPVESNDLCALLDMAFWREGMRVKVKGATNESVAMLLACEYEKSTRLPPCAASLLLSGGMNAAFVDPNGRSKGYKGTLVNTEIGAFDKSLPVTDVDLEVDWADGSRHGGQMFEKMVAGCCLGELCRRLILKVWQTEAPSLAWARQSLPTAAAALCVADESDNLAAVDTLMRNLWDWEVDLATRQRLQTVCKLVFHRSAGLAAIAVAAISKKTCRLQPAMGGVTFAVEGALHSAHPWYSEALKRSLKTLLGDAASLIHLYVVHDGPGKGGALIF